VRTEVRTGIGDGEYIEITNLQRPKAGDTERSWAPVTGAEKVILGDLSILADGEPVEVAPSPEGTKVADNRPAGSRPDRLAREP
jgi:hypothetical protein